MCSRRGCFVCQAAQASTTSRSALYVSIFCAGARFRVGSHHLQVERGRFRHHGHHMSALGASQNSLLICLSLKSTTKSTGLSSARLSTISGMILCRPDSHLPTENTCKGQLTEQVGTPWNQNILSSSASSCWPCRLMCHPEWWVLSGRTSLLILHLLCMSVRTMKCYEVSNPTPTQFNFNDNAVICTWRVLLGA